MIFCAKTYTLDLSKRTHLMGILNVTPDSFSDGGEFLLQKKAVERAVGMVEEGADIIDIGGESSRPGAAQVSEAEELKRVLPVIRAVSKRICVPISIDTYKPAVADAALQEGAAIVNDISALSAHPLMAEVAAKNGAGVILMHMKGTPATMQKNPQYGNVVEEVKSYLLERVKSAAEMGIPHEKIMIDPGIGFGKGLSHNLTLIKNLSQLKIGFPIVIGTSRKSFIGEILKLPVKERLEGTAATICISILNGASVVRVHDVKYMKRIAVITDRISHL